MPKPRPVIIQLEYFLPKYSGTRSQNSELRIARNLSHHPSLDQAHGACFSRLSSLLLPLTHTHTYTPAHSSLSFRPSRLYRHCAVYICIPWLLPAISEGSLARSRSINGANSSRDAAAAAAARRFNLNANQNRKFRGVSCYCQFRLSSLSLSLA